MASKSQIQCFKCSTLLPSISYVFPQILQLHDVITNTCEEILSVGFLINIYFLKTVKPVLDVTFGTKKMWSLTDDLFKEVQLIIHFP